MTVYKMYHHNSDKMIFFQIENADHQSNTCQKIVTRNSFRNKMIQISLATY